MRILIVIQPFSDDDMDKIPDWKKRDEERRRQPPHRCEHGIAFKEGRDPKALRRRGRNSADGSAPERKTTFPLCM